MSLYSIAFVAASTEYLSLAAAVGGANTALTFAGWAKTTSAAAIGGDCALAAFGFSTNPAGTSFGVDGGKATYKYYNSGFHIFKGATVVNDGAWHHIAVTHDASGNVTIYVDGVVDGTGAIAWSAASGTKLDVLGANYGGFYFDGQLSELYYYDRDLTGAEVGQLFTFTDPTSTANLLGKYLFAEGSGTTTADSSASNNTATFTNSPAWISGDHPEFGFPAQLHVSTSAPTIRPDLTLTLSLTWLSGVQGPATVWTPTLDDPTVGTFSPTSATLAATSGATGSIGLTISGTATVGSHTITWTNNQGLPAHTTTFSIVVPGASLTAARISPGGNWLYLEGSSHFTAYAGGATLTVNGTVYDLVNPLFDATNANMMFALNTRHEAIIDDVAAVAAGSGTGVWTPVTTTSPGIWYGEALQTSPTATATAVYTFTGVVPGTYMIQSIDSIDPTHTTHAQYHVADGVSLSHNFAVDQTVSGAINSTAGAFDDCNSFYDWTNRGTVVVTGTTLTVTLSNVAGTGLLAADAVRIKRLISLMTSGVPIVQSGDAVTLDFPDSCITCSGGTIGHTPTTANPLVYSGSVPNTRREWYSYTTGPHSLKLGFNLGRFDILQSSRLASNWRLGAEVWGGAGTHGFGVDAEGNLNSMAADGMVRCQFASVGPSPPNGSTTNGDDSKNIPIWPGNGNATVLYSNTPPVHFTLTLVDDFGVSGTVGATSTPVADAATGKQLVTIPYTAPTNLTTYSTGLTLQVTSTGASNNYPTGVEIRDPSMDGVAWNKFVHKATYDRIVPFGFTGPLRFMDILGTNDSNVGSYADLYHPDQHTAAINHPILIPVASIEPVDLTGADVDQALHYFGTFNNSSARAVVKVRLAMGHTCTSLGLKSGMIVLSDASFVPGYTAGRWASTIGLGTDGIYLDSFSFAAVTGLESDAVFLMTAETDHAQGTQLTLAGVQSVSGNLVCNRQPAPLSINWIVQCCNELGMDLYFNIPHIWDPNTDPTSFTDLATYIATHLNPGLKCHFEGTNELFSLLSPGEQQGYWFKSLGCQQGLNYYAAYARWVGQWTPLVRAAFATAGRAADCKIVLGVFLNTTDATIQSLDQWFADYPDPVAGPNFDYLAVSLYPENSAAWTLDSSYALANSDAQALVELANVTIIKNSGVIGAIDGHVAKLADHASYGTRFAGVKICLYESSLEIMSGGGNGFAPTESHEVYWHPDAYHLEAAFLESISQPAHNVEFKCQFGLDLAGGLPNGSNWQQYRSVAEPAGTGTEPVGNPFNQLTAPSHVAGAYRAFAAAGTAIVSAGHRLLHEAMYAMSRYFHRGHHRRRR